MERFDGDANVQLRSIGFLGILCFDISGCRRVASDGFLRRIAVAMQKHIENADLQRVACRSLFFFSLFPENQKTVVDGGFLPLLSAAVDRHSEDEKIAEYFVRIVSLLCCSAECGVTVRSEDVVRRVRRVMSRFFTSTEILYCGLLIQQNSSSSPSSSASSLCFAPTMWQSKMNRLESENIRLISELSVAKEQNASQRKELIEAWESCGRALLEIDSLIDRWRAPRELMDPVSDKLLFDPVWSVHSEMSEERSAGRLYALRHDGRDPMKEDSPLVFDENNPDAVQKRQEAAKWRRQLLESAREARRLGAGHPFHP
jgi:hypothetical protein